MLQEFAGILLPVISATVIFAGGAFAIRKYAGPAQAAYNTAMEGRLRMAIGEAEDLRRQLDALTAEVQTLRTKVGDLERQVRDLMAENLDLRRGIEPSASTPRRSTAHR